jgi:hypothetical protein
MFNLIPEQYKQMIIHEYHARLRILWGIGLLCLVFSFLILIIPSYVSVYFAAKNMRDQAGLMKSSFSFKNADAILGTITETNKQLQVASLFQQKNNPLSFFEQAVGAKNTAIHIVSSEYSKRDTGNSDITISGIADTRDALRLYINELNALPIFSDVYLPISSFVKDKNIEFSITLTHHE